LDDNVLKEYCVKFCSIFSHDNSSNIDVDDLLSELRVLQFILSSETMFAIDILKFVKDKIVIQMYQVLLTMHVTVAST
jgi:hypothetical protein